MFERVNTVFQSKTYEGPIQEQYGLLSRQLDALLDGESDQTANLSNASALLNQFLKDVNWVGFYIWKDGGLVLGPFQGLPACVRIAYGKGVCGTAVKDKRTMRVDDVHQFPGHIACDAASNSEIVIPLIRNGELLGVLDIDSPLKNRFSEDDEKGLEQFVQVLLKHV
nr:GAF domain-containing protein [Salipaludibacillus sp. CUR1]